MTDAAVLIRRGRIRRRVRSALVQVLALAIGLVVVFPVLYGIFGAFRAPSEFYETPPRILPASFAHLDNFREVFATVPMLRSLLNSLIVAVGGSVARLFFALLAAYALAFYDFRGKGVFFALMMGTMMLPGDLVLISNYRTVSGLGLSDTYLGLCITSLVGASQMFMLRQSFRQSPAALREAAAIDGAGDLRFIFRILLPVSMPVLATLFLQSFVALWNVYLWPLIITSRPDMRTVQVAIAMLTAPEATNYHTVLAGVTIALVPMLILFLLLRTRISEAMTAGAVSGE